MCIVKELIDFMKRGATTWSRASRGTYTGGSEAVNELRDELFNSSADGRSADRENLHRDRRTIESDMRRSYNQLVIG